jgi:hypothetical protein
MKEVNFAHGFGDTLFCSLFGSQLGWFYSIDTGKQMCHGKLRCDCPSKHVGIIKGPSPCHQITSHEPNPVLLTTYTAVSSLVSPVKWPWILLNHKD